MSPVRVPHRGNPLSAGIHRLKQDVAVYRLALGDPRTPRSSRWLLGAALAYLASPIDLVPDFLPVIGHLDDAILVPLLVWLALRRIPEGVLRDSRARVESREAG